MKKYIAVLAAILIFPALAGAQTQQRNQIQDPSTHAGQPSASPTGNQVQNQNQIQTENAGVEKALMVSTQHSEALNSAEQKAQGLSEIKTVGQTGQEIKEIALEQVQAQDQIKQNLTLLGSRGKVLKFFFGTDQKALEGLRKEMEQNELRIQALTELKNQVYNQSDTTQIQETIEALVEQNTALEEKIKQEEESFSILNWIIGLFS